MMEICLVCNGYFNAIGRKIHNERCIGNPISIDEDMIIPVLKFNKLGVQTYYCCSGHLYEGSRAYIAINSTIKNHAFILRDSNPKYSQIEIKYKINSTDRIVINAPDHLHRKYHQDDYTTKQLRKIQFRSLFMEYLFELIKLVKENPPELAPNSFIYRFQHHRNIRLRFRVYDPIAKTYTLEKIENACSKDMVWLHGSFCIYKESDFLYMRNRQECKILKIGESYTTEDLDMIREYFFRIRPTYFKSKE